jgi:hypothetical protein
MRSRQKKAELSAKSNSPRWYSYQRCLSCHIYLGLHLSFASSRPFLQRAMADQGSWWVPTLAAGEQVKK